MKRKISIIILGVLFLGINIARAGNTGGGEILLPDVGLPNPPEGIKSIVENLLSWLLGILGAVAVISFIISGMQYMTAAGDEKQAEVAKRNFKYSIYGIIVALSGFVIIQAVDTALNASGLF